MLKKFVATLMSTVMICSAFCFNVSASEEDAALVAMADTTISGSGITVETINTHGTGKGEDLIILMDTSGSLSYESLAAEKDLVKDYSRYVISANSSSRVAVITFDRNVNLICEYTRDLDKLNAAVDKTVADGLTYMAEAIDLAIDTIQSDDYNAVKEIYIISDGMPNGSEYVKGYDGLALFSRSDYPDCWSDDIACANAALEGAYRLHKSGFYITTQGVYDFDVNNPVYDSDRLAVDLMRRMANPPERAFIDNDWGDVIIPDVIVEEETETTTKGTTGGNSSDKAVVKRDDGTDKANSGRTERNTNRADDVYYYGALKDFPLIETYEITNKEGAVSAVSNMVDLISADSSISIDDDDVNLELVNFANEAIALASSQELPSDGILTAEIVDNAAQDAKDAKKAVDNLLDSKNVDLINPTLTSANIVSSSNTVQIDENVDALSIDNLNIIVGDGAGRITFGKDFISENANADEPIIISFEVEGAETAADDVSVTSNEETDETEEVAASNVPSAAFTTNLKTFSRPVVLSLNLISNASPTYQGVTGPDGYAVSKPNNSTRKIDFRATANGTYTVKNVTSLDFTDINTLSSAQQDTLRKLYAHGLIEGKSKTSFAPTTTLTRAEFTTLLVKTMGEYDPHYKGTSGFVDMKNQWSAPIIAKAKDLGIIAGYDSDNTFRPDNKLNNEQLYHLLGLAFTKSNKKASANTSAQISKLSDGSSIAPWAQKNVAVSLQYNIYVPREDGAFASRNEVTRYSAAVAMGNLFDKAQFTASWK